MSAPDPTPPDSDDIQVSMAAMARHRRRIAQSRSPDEHLRIVERLQREAMKTICSDPVAYQAFMARNHRKRRQDAVARLQAQLFARRDRGRDE